MKHRRQWVNEQYEADGKESGKLDKSTETNGILFGDLWEHLIPKQFRMKEK